MTIFEQSAQEDANSFKLKVTFDFSLRQCYISQQDLQ